METVSLNVLFGRSVSCDTRQRIYRMYRTEEE